MPFRLLFLLSIAISASITAFAGNEVRTTDKVTSATIFINGAQLFSTAQASVESGTTDVIITNIPSNVNEQSIQVTGYGNFTVLSVATRKNFLTPDINRPAVKQLKDSIDALMMIMEEDQNRKFALDQEENLVLQNKSIGGANTGVIVADLEDAADFIRNRLNDIRSKLLIINKRIRLNQEKLNRLQNQLNQANVQAGLTQTEIVVTLSAGAKGLIGMELNYVVNDAGWEPFYDIKSKGAGNPLEIVYKAKVYQNTGINWENIKLTLSSGDPNSNGIKPEMEPWRLNYEEPAPSIQSNMLRYEMDATSAGAEYDKKVYKAAVVNLSTVARREFTENFEVSIPYSVESGGRPAYVELQNYTVPAVYQQATIPKLDEQAYILARIFDWEKLSLISAPANVFFEGSFIGETYLNTQQGKDTLDISLGRDKGIIVKREKLKDLSTEKFIGGTKRINCTYKITLRNTKTKAVTIDVEDQIPLSEQSAIEVKPGDLQGASYDPSTGKLHWKLNIPSGTAAMVQFSFEVKYPKEKRVAGL